MTIEHELLTKWINAHANAESARKQLEQATSAFEQATARLMDARNDLLDLVPDNAIRRFLFKGQVIKVSQTGGVQVSDVEEVKE